jgi:hypothetical protein
MARISNDFGHDSLVGIGRKLRRLES